ncbi:MAG: peptide chain release factor N(5)-glutamine methyltransferase [Holophagaceae bacterium]|nr:peptide chain release factor N(5)-glutamine methyltransferase [Holophagaceae bacterium]
MTQTWNDLRLDLAAALAEFLEPLEARAETARWFEEGLGRTPAWLAAHGTEAADDDARRRISAWVRRRRTGEPWAYILGWTTFAERRFTVGPGVLIPRPETELTLELALATGHGLGVTRACDIGTGSGILATSLALATRWRIDAVDLSPEALAIARDNARALGATVTFHQGDLLDLLPDPLELVVANLPYVDPADGLGLQVELRFEPALALFAEDRGLALSTRLLAEAFRREARACVLEIGAGQGAELMARAKGYGWRKAEVSRDLAGHDRVLVVQR